MKLNSKSVAHITLPPGRNDLIFWDDELPNFGLRLWRFRERIRATWVIQYRTDSGIRRRLTIAPGSLAPHTARELAVKELAKARVGGDPRGEKVKKRLRGSKIFLKVVEDFIDDRTPKWRPKTLRQYKHILLVCWQPLHSMELTAVTRADIATVLRRIERERGVRAASLARARLNTLYIWAMGEGLVEINPVTNTRKVEYTGKRERVLSDEEIKKIWQACSDPDNFPKGGNFGRVVKLIILLGARHGEITGMQWRELDLKQGIWVLPAARSKNKREHTLPLSPAALAIFGEVTRERFNGRTHAADEYVFSSWGSMNVDRPRNRIYEQSGTKDWWLHDLRRTVATGMGNLGIQPHVVECVMNHVSGFRGGVAGTYNKSTYEREMTEALRRWSEHITGLVGGPASNVATLQEYTELRARLRNRIGG
jgi:integrase